MNFKKILAGVAAGALTVSSLALNAFAEDLASVPTGKEEVVAEFVKAADQSNELSSWGSVWYSLTMDEDELPEDGYIKISVSDVGDFTGDDGSKTSFDEWLTWDISGWAVFMKVYVNDEDHPENNWELSVWPSEGATADSAAVYIPLDDISSLGFNIQSGHVDFTVDSVELVEFVEEPEITTPENTTDPDTTTDPDNTTEGDTTTEPDVTSPADDDTTTGTEPTPSVKVESEDKSVAVEGAIAEDTVVKVEKPDTIAEDAKEVAYEITLENAKGEAVDLKGAKVTVTIKVPEAFKDAEKLYVYYKNADGKIAEDMKAELKDGVLTFETTHFSTYVISREVKELEVAAPGNTDNNEGGDKNQPTGVALVLIPVAAAAAGVVISRKRK